MSNYLDSARIAERYCERALVPSAPWYPGALERLVVSSCPELPRIAQTAQPYQRVYFRVVSDQQLSQNGATSGDLLSGVPWRLGGCSIPSR